MTAFTLPVHLRLSASSSSSSSSPQPFPPPIHKLPNTGKSALCFLHIHSSPPQTIQVCSKKNAKSRLISCSAQAQPLQEQKVESGSDVVRERSVSVVLLAGGQGKRMGMQREIIKQNSNLHCLEKKDKILFTMAFRNAVDPNSELVCIHDSARPLVLSRDVKKVLKDGLLNGAAVLGVPVKATIKEANRESFVVKTLDRKTLWEMQTPQVIKPELLRKGFELVNREGLEVTDDVSIVEHLKHPVYITEGSYTNIKVTTPDDMLLAERILNINPEENIVLPIHL
ncbi:unnamed protein product [Sphenostylis stenocarpa]|uniref:2-C-methyl-D-erythritol 4-phosphate cytidylyltransferase n=1 Tax=Sphenostylis stenocarpa TaxID=92480 RepID=A0AA86SAP3_9FABA|nr:unnamed protein product [Sphenostylis stenocarpa]